MSSSLCFRNRVNRKGGKQMDHVIESLREWKRVFEEMGGPDDWKDERAIRCIENAIKELNKYYKRGEIE